MRQSNNSKYVICEFIEYTVYLYIHFSNSHTSLLLLRRVVMFLPANIFIQLSQQASSDTTIDAGIVAFPFSNYMILKLHSHLKHVSLRLPKQTQELYMARRKYCLHNGNIKLPVYAKYISNENENFWRIYGFMELIDCFGAEFYRK